MISAPRRVAKKSKGSTFAEKADKATMDSELATINSQLGTKAQASTMNSELAKMKADQSTMTSELAKMKADIGLSSFVLETVSGHFRKRLFKG